MTFRLPFTGERAVMPLRGPTSQVLSLASGEEKSLSWDPQDRRQVEIEIRARIMAAQAPVGSIPLVRWAIEYGHGDATWQLPTPQFPVIAGTQVEDPTLPARGMVFRLNARQFRIRFRNAGLLTLAPLPNVVVQVTILPTVGGMQEPLEVRSTLAGPVVAGRMQPFPMGAREWQLVGADGLAPGAGTVILQGIAGALIGPVAFASFAAWEPIAHEAVGWLASAPVWAVYR